MTTFAEQAEWTIAYRKTTGPWFQRVPLELTWTQAHYLAGDLATLRPDLEVYCTTNKQWDAKVIEQAKSNSSMEHYLADVGNILAYGGRSTKGKRVAVKDTGKLDPRLTIMSAADARAKWETIKSA